MQRLSSNASFESFLDYYRRRVQAVQDPLSGIITLTVQAFSPEMAARLNQEITILTEKALNDFSANMAASKVAFAENELKKDELRVFAARQEILVFQNKNQVLDPSIQGDSKNQVITRLQADASQKETELKVLQNYLQPDTFQITSVNQSIEALRKQIVEESRLLTESNKTGINQTMFAFDELKLKLEFALEVYKASLANLEATRLDAAQQLKFLVVISHDPMPQEAAQPRKIQGLIIVLVLSLIAFGIIQLLVATVREHSL